MLMLFLLLVCEVCDLNGFENELKQPALSESRGLRQHVLRPALSNLTFPLKACIFASSH